MVNVFRNLDWTYLIDLVLSVIPALLCITVHEMSHGFCAYLLGDTTAKDMGRLSLNPLRHIDIMGMIMLMLFHVGWAKPVQIDMYRFKNPKAGMALSALAGPVSNYILAALAFVVYGFAYPFCIGTFWGEYLLRSVYYIAALSIGLGTFNLIPIPPLDGSKVLFSFASGRFYDWLMRYEKYGFFLVFALVFLDVLNRPLNMVIDLILDKMFVIAQSCFELILLFI